MSIWASLIRDEAVSSCALDGQTQSVGRHHPRRERPGFGCPHCGTPLTLDGKEALQLLAAGKGLTCCGYFPTDDEAVRWCRAARIFATGHSAH